MIICVNRKNMNRKTIASVLVAAFTVMLLMCGCQRTEVDKLQTGDLVFVTLPYDYQIVLPDTADKTVVYGDRTIYIHVSIAEVDADSVWIIDATLAHGVDRHPIDTLFADFTLRDGSLPRFEVFRLKDNSNAAQYVKNAKHYLGSSYDMSFVPDNDEYYCCELVRDSYVTDDGEHIFGLRDVNFSEPDGTIPVYWTQLFNVLMDRPVPTGIEGTTVRGLTESEAVTKVDVDVASYAAKRN